MKSCSVLLSLLLLLALCCSLASCAGGGNVFALLSVRLKGNGDGTVTAVARNEFALSPAALPVRLTLYVGAEAGDVSEMRVAGCAQTDDLGLFAALEVSVSVEEPAYYCAEIVYIVHGEEEILQSGTVRYDASGTRVAAMG